MDNPKQVRVPGKLLLNPLHFLSLGLGSGLSPKMPGTMGTIIGVLLFVALPNVSWELYLGILISSFMVGIILCDYTAKALKVHDHPAIVWDEIVGFFITMFMVPKTWVYILVGFVLFRFFDILKPWPISLADKNVKGGLGIMLDDVIAGIFALIIIQIFLYLL